MVFLNHKDLARLVEEAQKGDVKAFEKIYEHTATIQYYQLRNIMPDKSEAQDALQETYFLLYQNIGKINPPAALIAYLNRLTFYVGKNMSRRSETFHKRNVNMEEGYCVPDPSANFCAELEKKELSQELRSALKELPEQERLVLTARYYQEQTLQQIAYSNNMSLSTVKRIQRSAKRNLRSKLEKRGILNWNAVVPPLVAADSAGVAKNLPGLNLSAEGKHMTCPNSLLEAKPPVSLISGGAATAIVKSIVIMIGITGTATVASAFTPAPTIKKVTVPDGYHAAPVEMDISLSSALPLSSVKLVSSSGQSISLTKGKEEVYTAKLTKNGDYTFSATTTAGKSVEKRIQVDCIDSLYPKLVSVEQYDKLTEVTLSDEGTGIDFDSLYCVTENGTVTMPISKDTASGRVSFILPKADNKINFSDKAGNTCTIRLKLKEGEGTER